MSIKARLIAVSGALTLALVLAACGGQDAEPGADSSSTAAAPATQASPATAGAHNDADIEFAQMMAVHHEGAIVMANLATRSGDSEEIKSLGARISAAQGPEIDAMHSWLLAWGAPTGGDSSMEGMDMGGDDQSAAMEELRPLTGAEFDRRFLELMIEHHRGAITMAETELAAGESPEALALAQTIIDAQKAEITEMEQLLQAL